MSFKRIIVLFSSITILLGVLVFRLYDIIQNNLSVSANQTINSYKLVIDKNRGTIYDRNLLPLTSNEKVYKVAVLPSVKSKLYLKNVLSVNEFASIEQNFLQNKPFTFETDKFIEENEDVEVFIVSKRYSDKDSAKHVIGYCDLTYSNGITGIEKAYNDLLISQTKNLSISYPMDATGKILSGTKPLINDSDFNSASGIALTIDAKIQEIAEKAALNIKSKGSVLVMDIQNGDILAAVSVPNYDRNNIASSINNNDSSLLNRNFCAYNIGSTYKIIVSAAALSKDISTNFSYRCTGNLQLSDTTFNCHKKSGHGYLNMEYAFANSCNPYFIKLGTSVGKERLLSLSSAFGLGKEISLCDNISTASGNLPDSTQIITAGDLANVSFGQGSLMATPVHIAKIISIIANGGYSVSPSLVVGNVDSDGKLIKQQKKSENLQIISSDIAKKIREFMVKTVKDGTGKLATPKHLGAGGKTASAETGLKDNGAEVVQAWFSGFYPANSPKYAIVVLSEGGNSGATSCGPIFKEICDKLYDFGYCN